METISNDLHLAAIERALVTEIADLELRQARLPPHRHVTANVYSGLIAAKRALLQSVRLERTHPTASAA